MADFLESLAKKIVRARIFEEACKLNSDKLFSYFGLPGRECSDIKAWEGNLRAASCCEVDPLKYSEMERTAIRLLGARATCLNMNIWNCMKNDLLYFVDVCNFDFFGGISSSKIPEIEEFKSLYDFFSNQRKKTPRDFLIAWTLGVRNSNFQYYKQANTNFITEVYSKSSLNMKRLDSWLSEKNKKMIRNYMIFVPCISFDYAQKSRYTVEIVDSRVYKNIMYFALLRFKPTNDQISPETRHGFIEKTLKRNLPIYNEHGDLEKIESFRIDELLD